MTTKISQTKLDIAEAAGNAVKAIASAAGEAVKLIASSASDAARVVSATASEAAKITAQKTGDDHDTIITLVGSVSDIDKKFTEKFSEIREDIKEIKDGMNTQLSELEERTSKLENKSNWFAGALALVGICTSLIVYIYFMQMAQLQKNIDTHITQTVK